ncbi:DUF1798 family protein [Staphylococcus caledonicus]|uniref:DUF1798 family protein n=1 Tax=Staphylococcus caledonicus TaxID=2741333 RepID=UPI000D1C3D52|nr:DUF1798 family protein [Staphylococcus caledonicus]MBI5972498.1 DUF1798 family protein [Staphylococcus caledonicus]PTE67830.1 DUF1798 domain-containing protein [Staphylococcus devriesei]
MYELINEMLLELYTIERRYNEVKVTNQDFDFYETVYPYAQRIDKKLQDLTKYKDEIINLPYMNSKKFDLLINTIKELSVDCHFQRTSRKLFTEKLKAVNYDLNYILQSSKEE